MVQFSIITGIYPVSSPRRVFQRTILISYFNLVTGRNFRRPFHRQIKFFWLKWNSCWIGSYRDLYRFSGLMKGWKRPSWKIPRMWYLCVQIHFLDTWTDLLETLGLNTVRPGLLDGALIHLRSETQNRKLAVLLWNRVYFRIKIYCLQ